MVRKSSVAPTASMPGPSALEVPVIESGVVRYAVFPNNIRELRGAIGYSSLRAFEAACLPEITYIRLAKIERGQIFPKPSEVKALAAALGVPVVSLFIDPTDPAFDHETWARSQTGTSFANAGGNRNDMRLGAAMRLRREDLGMSISDLSRRYRLPAATASRIENADRPFASWPDDIRREVLRFFDFSAITEISAEIDAYDKAGRLGPKMETLFSPAAIASRNCRSLLALINAIDDRSLDAMRGRIEGQIRAAQAVTPTFNVVTPAVTIPVLSANTHEGVSRLFETGETRQCRAANSTFGIRIDSPVLGRGLQTGAIVEFEDIDRHAVADGMIIAIIEDGHARIVSVCAYGRRVDVFQDAPPWKDRLETTPGRVAKATAIILPN